MGTCGCSTYNAISLLTEGAFDSCDAWGGAVGFQSLLATFDPTIAAYPVDVFEVACATAGRRRLSPEEKDAPFDGSSALAASMRSSVDKAVDSMRKAAKKLK